MIIRWREPLICHPFLGNKNDFLCALISVRWIERFLSSTYSSMYLRFHQEIHRIWNIKRTDPFDCGFRGGIETDDGVSGAVGGELVGEGGGRVGSLGFQQGGGGGKGMRGLGGRGIPLRVGRGRGRGRGRAVASERAAGARAGLGEEDKGRDGSGAHRSRNQSHHFRSALNYGAGKRSSMLFNYYIFLVIIIIIIIGLDRRKYARSTHARGSTSLVTFFSTIA